MYKLTRSEPYLCGIRKSEVAHTRQGRDLVHYADLQVEHTSLNTSDMPSGLQQTYDE
jgi:hypothetical protein